MMKIFAQNIESELEDSSGEYETAVKGIVVTDGPTPFVTSVVT